jgi:hypothetical protein
MAGGSFIFLAFVVLFLLSVIYGLYTSRGSGISQRPYGKVYGGAPGARSASTLGHDQSAAARLTRGTR